MKKDKMLSLFSLEGRFVGFIGDFEENPKRMRVATSQREYWVKLSKELRSSMREVLQHGDWIQVSGEQKLKKTGELKLKAYQITLTTPRKQQGNTSEITETQRYQEAGNSLQIPSTSPHSPRSKSCIMVCQKSSCCKRGAREVGEALTEALRDRGLQDQVAVKGTGCMKQCKSGPCVVFMPDKSRYSGVAPKEIPKLVEKHFAGKLKPEESQLELSAVT